MPTRPDVYAIDNVLNTHTLIERHITSNNKRVKKALRKQRKRDPSWGQNLSGFMMLHDFQS